MRKISVIMPAFNMEMFIREAILSAVNQEGIALNDIEIIVVNDGSQDNTQKTVEGLMHEFEGLIKLVDLKINTGTLTATIEGLKIANGEYICLLDADDVWYPVKLREVISCFNEGCDLVFHEGEFIDNYGSALHKLAKCRVKDEEVAYYIRTFNGGVPLGSNICFRRTKFDLNLLISVYRKFKEKGLERLVHQDTSILHTLLSQKNLKIKCIRNILYGYRMHGGNNSQHADFDNPERLNKTFLEWLQSIMFAIEIYKKTGLYYEDKSIDIGLQKFLYHKNFTLKEKPIIALLKDYLFLLKNHAFIGRREQIVKAIYPFFYRLPLGWRPFLRKCLRLF